MIAYSKTSLENLHIHDELDNAFGEKLIDQAEMENAKKSYPHGLYMPNLFIRIGLFVLTVIVVSFSCGLLSMLVLSSTGKETFGVLSVFCGLMTYGALEFMVSKRFHFKSGADDALEWMSALMFVGGLNGLIDIPLAGNCVLVFLIALFLSLRFTDSLMSSVACLALLAVVFLTYIKFGDLAKATASFIIMITAALVYLFAKNKSRQERLRPYNNCLVMTEITALICFYLAGNYYVVRETSNGMFHLNLKEGESIPLDWLFWALTVLVPLVYLGGGILKKDRVLLRLGLVLTIVTVLTIRFYHAMLPLETAMTLGGIILTGISYALIRYLRTPKHGFTYMEPVNKTIMDRFQVESLVIVESFGQPQQPAGGDVRFGGGSGGGAGATGEF